MNLSIAFLLAFVQLLLASEVNECPISKTLSKEFVASPSEFDFAKEQFDEMFGRFCDKECQRDYKDRKSELITQDEDFLYIRIPAKFDLMDAVTRRAVMAGVEAAITGAGLVLEEVNLASANDFSGYLERVDLDYEVEKILDLAQRGIHQKIERASYRGKPGSWWRRWYPDSLFGFVGTGINVKLGVGGGLTAAIGVNLMRDKVYQIRKGALGRKHLRSLLKIVDPAAQRKVQDTHATSSALKDFFDGGLSAVRVLTREEGLQHDVSTYYETDSSIAIIFTPSLGVGGAVGAGVRLGLMPIWGRRAFLEPEDIYGGGLAYSANFSFGAGGNFKVGAMNSENLGPMRSWDIFGVWDYSFISVAASLGGQVEMAPFNVNAVIISSISGVLRWIPDMAAKKIQKDMMDSMGGIIEGHNRTGM